jgi:hypothetical protein
MRYYKSEEHTFETADGRQINLKEILPIPSKAFYSMPVKIDSGVMLDEIASRPEIYGEGMEAEAYRIFDENIVELFEARFNMANISALRAPS